MEGYPDDTVSVRWSALTSSAAAVRGSGEPAEPAPRTWRRVALVATYTAALGGLAAAGLTAAGGATPVHADGSADAALFSLTNQDRVSNGVRSVISNGTLSTIGEGGRYGGCPGLVVWGRSVDMIQRNYFAHPILGCGQYVFSIMQAYGIRYQSAGENIGWNQYGNAGTAAAAINQAFMNSPEHRSNILDGSYTQMGAGSDNSGSAGWTGDGGPYVGVWMFSEEFAQIGAAPPPPPPPPPPQPTSAPPVRNTPAPGPAPPPATATVAPAPAASATPAPVPSPIPTPLPLEQPPAVALPSLTLPPLVSSDGGLLFDSVESVLENYLIG